MNIFAQLNIVGQCRKLNIPLWSCPRFLFIVMGAVIIFSILATYVVGQRYATPEMVIIAVTVLTVALLIITHIIVGAFEEVVAARKREAERAKEVLMLRDQFVYVAVHDIRSAGTAVKWSLRLLEGNDLSAYGGKDKVIRDVRRKNNELLGLARNILLLTRIDSGEIALSPETVALADAIPRVIADDRELAEKTGVVVALDIPQDLPHIRVDVARLGEIASILFADALRRADRPGGEVRVSAAKAKDRVVLSFENNGPEITPAEAEKLFRHSWQQGRSGSSGNAGIGLYVVRRLVELSGGEVSYESDPTRTAFHIALPEEVAKNER